MKKLIDELIIARDNADSIKEAQAAQLCINIVRAHNPWHEVGELPPVEELEPDFSIDVMLSDGRQYALGYYIYETRYWNTTIRRGQFKPTHWAYLPEVKP